MFAMTGIWNSVFLVIYSLVGASRLMKWSTRSTEEIFALFISIAFTVDTCKDIYSGNQDISPMNYPLLKMQRSSTAVGTYFIDLSYPNPSHGKAKIHLFFFFILSDFKVNYDNPDCHEEKSLGNATAEVIKPTTDSMLVAITNAVTASDYSSGYGEVFYECLRENSLLFLLLTLGTAWLGLSLFNFTKTLVHAYGILLFSFPFNQHFN